MEYLENKRLEVLEAIKPICEAFNIGDYDYLIKSSGQRETLRIGDIHIGCTSNSISAVIQELVGYIFITTWRGRGLGAFDTQAKNVIRRYWIEGDK